MTVPHHPLFQLLDILFVLFSCQSLDFTSKGNCKECHNRDSLLRNCGTALGPSLHEANTANRIVWLLMYAAGTRKLTTPSATSGSCFRRQGGLDGAERRPALFKAVAKKYQPLDGESKHLVRASCKTSSALATAHWHRRRWSSICVTRCALPTCENNSPITSIQSSVFISKVMICKASQKHKCKCGTVSIKTDTRPVQDDPDELLETVIANRRGYTTSPTVSATRTKLIK